MSLQAEPQAEADQERRGGSFEVQVPEVGRETQVLQLRAP